MHKSVLYWLVLTYKRRYEDDIKVAADEKLFPDDKQSAPDKKSRKKKKPMKSRLKMSAARDLQEELERLMKRWQSRFDKMAKKIAEEYTDKTNAYTYNTLNEQLKAAGFTVKGPELTPELRAVMESAVLEQVSLIKSIPSQYHTEVAGLVQRAFQSGRDVKGLSDDLRNRYAITSRRAYLIARDQMNKTNDVITRTRNMNMGITEGIWMHRAGGSKTFRKRHVEFDGTRFNLAEGLYDDTKGVERYVHPGELPYCFPPETIINACPYIHRITKRYFTGNLRTIRLLGGELSISCTPNHPIFTRGHGWKAACEITKNMSLVVLWPQSWINEGTAPTIAELYEAWDTCERNKRQMKCSPSMFHGDGQHGDLYIADRALMRDPSMTTVAEFRTRTVPKTALTADELTAANVLDIMQSPHLSPFAFVKVDSVDIVPYSGYVYNLETEKGWYIAERALVHNCKCTYQPIIPGLDE